MEYSGNSFKDAMDKQRELDEKVSVSNEFVCPICKLKTHEDHWHWGYEICFTCFQDYADDLTYKHREERGKSND